jgi:hypothetical protein
MPQTFLQPWAKALVLFHALSAIVLMGSSTHHVIITWGYWRGRHQGQQVRLGKIYAPVAAISYVITFALGALAYPTYRYFVRGLYFDRYAPWASNLFDVKENLAAMALPMVLGAWALSRVMDPQEHRSLLWGYTVLVGCTGAVVWFDVITGLLITMTRGV